ncbi:MAG: thioesterase domain-containing protein [Cuspidothrix sp.]
MFADIERKFAKKLPLAVLLSSPTIENLAEIIQQETVLVNTANNLVEIQTQGTKPPLFMLHPMGGEVLCYRHLAKYLGLEQPMYGLQPQGLDGKLPPLLRVEDIASQYLQQIRTVQPQGPYFLLGYSFGGVIAYEIAQQLHQQGQEVAFLAMLDTCRPGYKQRLSFLQRLTVHINHIYQRGPKYIARKYKGWYTHADYYVRKSYNDYLNLFFEFLKATFRLPGSNKYSDVYNAHLHALNHYVFQPYPGKVTLFRTKDEDRTGGVGVKYDPTFGWGDIITGELDMNYIPGSHISILDEPNVNILAKEVEICLEKAHTNSV